MSSRRASSSNLPWSMMPTQSAMRSTSERWWEDINIVRPSPLKSSISTRRSWSVTAGLVKDQQFGVLGQGEQEAQLGFVSLGEIFEPAVHGDFEGFGVAPHQRVLPLGKESAIEANQVVAGHRREERGVDNEAGAPQDFGLVASGF